uniref:Uncharacterized protein n=2 Tax=Caenorhabditis japonica TaxID=281687 RepID=A0A8R1E0H0_CAEJA
MEIVSRAGWISDDDIEVDVSVQEEEEYMSLESEDEGPDPAHDAEPDFPLPVINNEVQVPARQPEHPFHDQYAPREGEEPPKDVAKRLVASVLLSQVQAFRMKTLSWFDPIEKPAPPVLTPEDEAVEQVVSLPATPFALYVVHVHRGSSAALGSVHRELAADDRPDLIYVNFQPRYARESTTGGAHSAEKFFPGDLLAVTRLGRLPSTTAEHFVRSHEGALQIEKHNFWTVLQYTLVKRTVASHTISYCARKQRGKNLYQIFASDFPVPVNVPTRFYSSEEGLRPGNFYRTTILTPQAHPAALLNNIKPGAAKQYVVRATNPLALRHKYRPTLMSATAPNAEDTRLLSLARNPYGTVDISNADALKSLLFAGRLAISAAIALTHRKTDSNFYTITSDHVVRRFRETIAKSVQDTQCIQNTTSQVMNPETSRPTSKAHPSPSIASKQHQSRANPSQSEQRYIHPKPSRMAERDPPEAVRPTPEPQEAECPKHLSWKKYKQQRGEESDNYLMDNENAHSTVIQL